MLQLAALIIILMLFVLIVSNLFGGGDSRKKKACKKALSVARARQTEVLKETKTVSSLVDMYATVAAEYGVDSVAAKALRFGTDGKAWAACVPELANDTAAMEAYIRECNLVDATINKTKKRSLA